jgi:hypothetical protein
MSQVLSAPDSEAIDEEEEDRADTAVAIAMSNDHEDMVLQVMNTTGCSYKESSEALATHGNNTSIASEFLLWGLVEPLYEHDI